VARAEYEAPACQKLEDDQLFFSMKVGHLPADFKDWETHMSITATAVVKNESVLPRTKGAKKSVFL
jgi:hypothetical protein